MPTIRGSFETEVNHYHGSRLQLEIFGTSQKVYLQNGPDLDAKTGRESFSHKPKNINHLVEDIQTDATREGRWLKVRRRCEGGVVMTLPLMTLEYPPTSKLSDECREPNNATSRAVGDSTEALDSGVSCI